MKRVWIKIINPMERGWFKKNIIKDINNSMVGIKIFIISNQRIV